MLSFCEVFGVAECLCVDFGEGDAVFFGFDYSDDFVVDVEEVVGVSAVSHGDFADCDSWSCAEVDVVAVLDDPACEFEVFVDDEACPLFGCESAWFGHRSKVLQLGQGVAKIMRIVFFFTYSALQRWIDWILVLSALPRWLARCCARIAVLDSR